ncbi:MAG: tetratricopeptide repeat protein [Chitinophagaceae bacterium]|nr:tetratricopeptide repeat protein [Chitinophagaceae bacterium]MCW5925847.1 tetratricopeptide repeat protein [Chitinophagaceae bacterium]
MYFSHRLLFFVLLFCSVPALSQEKGANDKLVSKATTAFALAFRNADSALMIAGEVLREAEKQDHKEAVAGAYNTIGWAFRHKGNLDSSLAYLEKALQGYRDLQSDRDIIRISINLGEVLTQKSHYAQALQHLLEGDSLSVLISDIPLQTDISRQLAIVYRESGDTRRASRYFQQALDGFEQQQDYFRYINTTVSLSILYRKMELPDSSLAVLERGLQLAQQNNGSPYQVAMIHENMGETYFSTGQFSDALLYFQKAYQTFQRINNQADLAYEALSIGKTLMELHRYRAAETYLLQSYGISQDLKATNYQLDAATILARLYERTGDWKNAHSYLQTHNILKDSLNLAAQLARTAELKERYESEKKGQEIALLKTQQELTQSKAKRASLLQYVFILLFVAAAAIAWLLAYRIRMKRKIEQMKEQERVTHELEDERIVNQFAISLYGRNTVEDILWDIANNCILLLYFEDCVVYRTDEERKVLVQTAAAGPKKIGEKRLVFNPIEIPFGKGIVGTVAVTGKPEIIADAGKDERYIVDDAARTSEITVPIFINGKVFGIIDSENTRKNFYTERHIALLQKISAVCAERLAKLLAEEKLRDAIARDLHDEMGSTLTSIHILSKLAMTQEARESRSYLGKIKEYAGSMMENMSDIVWAINPQHDTVERLLLRMKEFSVELLEPAGITCHFETAQLHDIPGLKPEERKFLYLIFKEALNNIVKYSSAAVVTVMIDRRENSLRMTITDNGAGFDPATVNRGNGLKNMETRARAIGGTLHIASKPGEGTVVTLEKRITS